MCLSFVMRYGTGPAAGVVMVRREGWGIWIILWTGTGQGQSVIARCIATSAAENASIVELGLWIIKLRVGANKHVRMWVGGYSWFV